MLTALYIKLYSHVSCLLTVETAAEQTCRATNDGNGIRITKPMGYLSNFVTAETNKGSADCPWILVGHVGQRFTLSLIDYGAPPGDDRSDSLQPGAW
jgi:hypothetical protein